MERTIDPDPFNNIKNLPELTVLRYADVSASPEATQQTDGPAAGEMEYARTVTSLAVLGRLYGDPHHDADPQQIVQDYTWIVEAQHVAGEGGLRADHLTLEELGYRRQELRTAFPDQESWNAVLYTTAIHDIMKSNDNLRAVGLTPGIDSHDEGLPRLLSPEFTETRDRTLPTWKYLTERQKQIVEGVCSIRGVNWPGILQSQAPAVIFSNLPQDLDPQILEAFIVHAEADIAGALGHIYTRGSATLNSPTFQKMRILREAVRRGGTPLELDEAFLIGCARDIYGVDDEPMSGRLRVTTRLANLLRASGPAEYDVIANNYDSQPAEVKDILFTMLNRTGVTDRAPNLEFLPALMVGLNRRYGLTITLKYLADVLQKIAIADQETRDQSQVGSFEVNLEALAKAAQNNTLEFVQPVRFVDQKGILIPPK